MFKSTLARFNRIYAFITQVCRLFDKEIHKFSVYAKFLYKELPSPGVEKVFVDDKVRLEYYRLEKEFEGSINLDGSEEGFQPITGEAGRGERKKDPLTAIIDKINKKYGTNFTEMDKVLLQIENDYAAEEKWRSRAQGTNFGTFMLSFGKDFLEMAAKRYNQNNEFFIKLFSEPEMMEEIKNTIGAALYARLKPKKKVYYMETEDNSLMAAENQEEFNKK